jgi:methylmalonyl-CoA/ethylmalonyl-CoA epimerase
MSDVALGDIGQIALPVTDMERAVTFYRDVLRLPFLFQAGPNLAFFQCGAVRLMLDIPEVPDLKPPGSVIYYVVSDIQEAYRTLLARGVIFVAEPHMIAKMPDHELWMAFFRDPEGNMVSIMCEVR